MKDVRIFFLLLVSGLFSVIPAGCDTIEKNEHHQQIANEPPSLVTPTIESELIDINIQIGSCNFTAKLFNNPTTQVLVSKMPMTLNMNELNGNEKYVYLQESLPTDSKNPEHISAGALMLYGSDCMVLFYEDFQSSYSYTQLGYIENPAELASEMGSEKVEVTFIASL